MNAMRMIGMIGVICGVMVTAVMAWLEVSAGRGINGFVWGFAIYTIFIAAVWYLGERTVQPDDKRRSS